MCTFFPLKLFLLIIFYWALFFNYKSCPLLQENKSFSLVTKNSFFTPALPLWEKLLTSYDLYFYLSPFQKLKLQFLNQLIIFSKDFNLFSQTFQATETLGILSLEKTIKIGPLYFTQEKLFKQNPFLTLNQRSLELLTKAKIEKTLSACYSNPKILFALQQRKIKIQELPLLDSSYSLLQEIGILMNCPLKTVLLKESFTSLKMHVENKISKALKKTPKKILYLQFFNTLQWPNSPHLFQEQLNTWLVNQNKKSLSKEFFSQYKPDLIIIVCPNDNNLHSFLKESLTITKHFPFKICFLDSELEQSHSPLALLAYLQFLKILEESVC